MSLSTLVALFNFADSSPLPIETCLGPGFVNIHEFSTALSRLNVITGESSEIYADESIINGAVDDIKSIGFDAYTRYLYTIRSSMNEPTELGRIGIDDSNDDHYSIDYTLLGVNPDFSIPVQNYVGDVFSPGGYEATTPGYFLICIHEDVFIAFKIPEEFGVDPVEFAVMTNQGDVLLNEYDLAFHPDAVDEKNAVFYSLRLQDNSYHLIRYIADFETFELSSTDIGPLLMDGTPVDRTEYIEAVFFDDFGYLYYIGSNETLNEASMFKAHIPMNDMNTDNINVELVGSLDANITTDGARCIGYSALPSKTPTSSTILSTSNDKVDTTTTDVECPCQSECVHDKPCRCDCYVPCADDSALNMKLAELPDNMILAIKQGEIEQIPIQPIG